MEKFEFKLFNLPEDISLNDIKQFCNNYAQNALDISFNPITYYLHFKFDNYDDYIKSFINISNIARDNNSNMSVYDCYSFKPDIDLNIDGTISWWYIKEVVVNQYKGKKNILMIDNKINFVANEELDDMFNSLANDSMKVDYSIHEKIHYLVISPINDDNIKTIIFHSNDYKSLINKLETFSCFNSYNLDVLNYIKNL